MAYNTLNRMKWTGKLGQCEVIILHRGALGDRKAISGKDFTEVRKTYFSYMSPEGEVTIPMHRVQEIRLEKRTVWKRKPRASGA